MFDQVRNMAEDPLRAARAYESIVQAINQAEAAARQALQTAQDSVRIVSSLSVYNCVPMVDPDQVK